MKLNEFFKKVQPLEGLSLTKIRGGQGQAVIIIEEPISKTDVNS